MKNVLLIDDDANIRQLVSAFLTGEGYLVHTAESADAAIQLISSGVGYNVAVVDFWLGTGNAVGLLDRIFQMSPSVPVILISGGGGNLTLETAVAVSEVSGALTFLPKPFQKSELVEAIQNATST